MTRTNDSFIVAYGLFQDVYAPVVEAILNLGLSVVLGYYYGLAGIIGGVIISLLFIAYGWKPYFYTLAVLNSLLKDMYYI